ncbi:unnamed protein product [Brassica oleracea var. botrytis]
MCALTPMFPSNQQEWYSTSTMEYPWLDSFSPTLPSSLYPSFDQLDEFKSYNINLLPHHMNLADINGTNNDQEEHQGSVLEKKLNHNASERDRRRKLNALYASLRALLPPSDQKRKLSIPKTIAGVVKYIPEQKQELQRLSRRKEELMKRISNKTETLNHQQEQLRNRALMMESIDSSSQKIAANWITDTEIAVQIATWKWTSISDILLRLEENGLNAISVSSSVSSTARIFYTLHLQKSHGMEDIRPEPSPESLSGNINYDLQHIFFLFRSLNVFSLKNDHVERGKQAQYRYDDADLKKITADFPARASYSIQRLKGKNVYTQKKTSVGGDLSLSVVLIFYNSIKYVRSFYKTKCFPRAQNEISDFLTKIARSFHSELCYICCSIPVSLSRQFQDNDDNLYKDCVKGGGGASVYITWLIGDKRPLHDVMGFKKEINDIKIDIALQWYVDVYSDTVLGYANGIHTVDGGTHIDGAKASITRTINTLGKKRKFVKDLDLSGEHIREGLTCIVAVVVTKPEFVDQTKKKLGNPKIREIVDKSVQEYLTEYFELHPDVFESIYTKSFKAYQKALALKRARKVILTPRTIPQNLTNSSSGKFEIFIAIGESSGGAAKHGDNDRRFQSKRTLEQPLSNGAAVSTAPPGRSLENTIDSRVDKKRQKVVPSSQHPSSSSRQTVAAASNRPNRKDVGAKTLKGVSTGSNKTKPVIPVGPGFQAEIPIWIASTKKGKFYGSPGDSDTLRWIGTAVWPTYSLKKKDHHKKVGEGRPDSCSCANPGSVDCAKLHIKEARELLEKETDDAFYTWKFDEMGEVGSKSWTAKEEQKFESLVKKIPLSSCDGFWKYASKAFPRRSEKDLISYYYNVFLNHRNTDDDHCGDFLADHR